MGTNEGTVLVATFVGAFGVPHVPMFADMVKREGASSETALLFARVREAMERARPDVLVMFDTDHLNTFFFDCLPTLAIGVAESFRGPNDEPPTLEIQLVPSDPAFARHVRASCIAGGYDLASSESFEVDHSVMIPLHFLTPRFDVPVVPIFINGHVPPLPSARRVFEFGRKVRSAIESFPDARRVAVVGSGSFSLEVLGPRVAPGRNNGVPDPRWAEHAAACFRDGVIAPLIVEATEARMLQAGNVAGELLNWIAMAGAGAQRPADWIASQSSFGHPYAVGEEAGQ